MPFVGLGWGSSSPCLPLGLGHPCPFFFCGSLEVSHSVEIKGLGGRSQLVWGAGTRYRMCVLTFAGECLPLGLGGIPARDPEERRGPDPTRRDAYPLAFLFVAFFLADFFFAFFFVAFFLVAFFLGRGGNFHFSEPFSSKKR